jgi:hypothetical protein
VSAVAPWPASSRPPAMPPPAMARFQPVTSIGGGAGRVAQRGLEQCGRAAERQSPERHRQVHDRRA